MIKFFVIKKDILLLPVPTKHIFNTLAYAHAHFTAYKSEFSTNSQKVLYLVEKLTSHYRDWFSSHSIHNPGILQNYYLFISALLSFSRKDKELSTHSTFQLLGLIQRLIPRDEYNQKFCSLQSRLQASDAKACSFYKIGLNKLLQECLVHHNFPDKLEPLIREVILEAWLQQYLSLKTQSLYNLSPAAQLFVPDKVPLSSTPPPGTKPKAGRGFCLTAEKVLRRRNNNFCSYCGSKDHLLPACPLSKCSPVVNKTSTITLLSLRDTSRSPTILVTINGPLGKIKVLALLNIVANANFIE
ncbi:Retrotransposon-derived protein peg10 [Entomophthora muscae]|uniref:Retrotransposon-derived protein peg10 n=1 Tax=Entomophthora muscae TaxID=34485 RepID=A0ACC2UH40_9FUNG|nr:Retrotransposon-derived protein peg10 [Entomophthora muscae]